MTQDLEADYPKEPSITVDPQAKAKAFEAELDALLKKYGYNLAPQIFFKQQIDGTHTIGAQLAIVPRTKTA